MIRKGDPVMPFSQLATLAQSGVCAEPNAHGYYLMFDIQAGAESEIRLALAHFPELCDELATSYPDAGFSGLVGIGAAAWDRLYTQRPPLLAQFPTMAASERVAPETPFDLFFQFRAERVDMLHLAGQRLMARLAGKVVLREEMRGFRFLDCRDLTGFVDGTENPQAEHRAEVALVAEGAFIGGSYLHVQRFVHNMAQWQGLVLKDQEDTIGRTKQDNIEYASVDKPLTCHIKRVNLKNSAGKSKEILRQSMPWGGLEEQGLYFISCCHTPEHFSDMLRSMIDGDGAGHFDHLLRFTRAVTGAAFFAPSRVFLRQGGITENF
jgi:porphyrinogen peroxidase